MEDTLLSEIEELMQHAEPGKATHRELLRLKGRLEQNIMIGPKAMRFIQSLHDKLDNIECRCIDGRGMCTKIKGMGRCPHTKLYKSCRAYEKQRPILRGNPIKIGG